MTEHTLHLPAIQRRPIECKPLELPGTCGYCGRPGAIQKSGQCKYCGTWMPSPMSYRRPKPAKGRKLQPRVDILTYEPQHAPENWPSINYDDNSVPWD